MGRGQDVNYGRPQFTFCSDRKIHRGSSVYNFRALRGRVQGFSDDSLITEKRDDGAGPGVQRTVQKLSDVI